MISEGFELKIERSPIQPRICFTAGIQRRNILDFTLFIDAVEIVGINILGLYDNYILSFIFLVIPQSLYLLSSLLLGSQ